MKYTNIIAACAVATFVSAQAEESSIVTNTADQIIVSATRIDTPIEQIGSSVSIIDMENIQLQHAQNVQSALKLTPGIQMTQSGGPGTASSVFIRGANANHTLVLINGVRVNSNTSGGFNLSSLPTAAIERIEVLRGPQSALYGSDAIGGVVNIVTKKGADKMLGGSATAEVGEKGYRNGSLNLYGGNEIFDINSSISFQGLEEYDIAAEYGGGEDDPYRGMSFYTGLGLNFMDDGQANLFVLYNNNKTEIDNFAAWPGWWQVDDTNRISRTEQWVTSLDISKPVTDNYTQKFVFGYNREESEGENDGIQEYEFKTWNYDFTAQADLDILENDTLNVGYDFRRSEAENDSNYEVKSRTQHALFLNNQWNMNNVLFLTLGGRYDDFSDIDGQATWNATASWFALEGTRLHGSVGTGYKAPTMNDLYWPTGLFSGGNPNLDPEKSESFDIGIEESLFTGSVVADITYFQSTVEDMIIWANDGTGFWTPSNVNEADIKGIETSLAVMPVENVTTKLFYTYTHAEDTNTGSQLARRARHTGGLSANWTYSTRGNIYVDYVYTGKRFDDAANNRELDAFGLVNIGTRYAVSESASLIVNIKNLCDKHYETAAGYGTVGRVASAGIEITF